MERRLRSRLGAARLVLEQAKDTASHQVVSRVQAAAVCELAGGGIQCTIRRLQHFSFGHVVNFLEAVVRYVVDISVEQALV